MYAHRLALTAIISSFVCIVSTLLPAQGFAQQNATPGKLFEGNDEDVLVEIAGYGGDFMFGLSATYTHQGRFEDNVRVGETPAPSGNAYGMLIEAGFMPFRTIFGARGGIEGSLGLGLPAFKSYFGGLRGNIGVILLPIPLGPLDLSVAAGAAIGGHRHLYLKPQAALSLGFATLAASYKWNPPKASRVYDEGGPPGTYGVGEERIRGQLWFQLREPSDDFGVRAVHVYGERTTISSPTPEILEQKRVIEGTYWGGGVGVSF